MAARTVSELANWDGRLDQHRQNSKWRSSSSIGRDLYHTPLSAGTSQHSAKLNGQTRAENSSLRPNAERGSGANSSTNARLARRVDTTSKHSYSIHYRLPSISLAPPRASLPPPQFTTLSMPSRFPNSSVPTSCSSKSRPPSSLEYSVLSQPASVMESEVIDLTIEDTEDDICVSDITLPNAMHFSHESAARGSRRRSLSSENSSSILPEHSLFTPPPPPERRIRLFIGHVEVPSFPAGLIKADYQPMSDYSLTPLPDPAVTNDPEPSLAELSTTGERTPPPPKWKGKEREYDVASSRQGPKQQAPPTGADLTLNSPDKLLDAFYELTEVPLYEDDTYPPLTTFDLAANTRFQFAHAWRAHASRLREAELDWSFKFNMLGKASIWARSAGASSPRLPGTTGYVSTEQLRPWKLVPLEKSSEHVSDEPTRATESYAVINDPNYLLLPVDGLPLPSVPIDPTPSVSAVAQVSSSSAVDIEHGTNEYFDELNDSPTKPVSSRQLPTSTNTSRSRPLQSVGRSDLNSLELGFPSLDFDASLADTSGHECFLGVPPSPITADVELPAPISDSPFEPVSFIAASSSNSFAGEAWTFEQGETSLHDNPSVCDDTSLTSLGTINPSLLGPEQPQTTSREHNHTAHKRRKLPKPVIYIRRPIDPSTLPLVSGNRSVQIKYRDSGGSPSNPTMPSEVSSNSMANPTELSMSDPGDPLPTKRHSVPSHKRREAHIASESDSDYMPETSKPEIKLKLKRPRIREKGSADEHQRAEAETVPVMTFCHQCRNKTARPKMVCSNTIEGRVCGKRFCNRCILFRYPDVTFDEHSAGFLCPVCTNTCNCSHCSRSRGEEFVSMKLGGLAASIFKSKVTFVRDVGDPLHRAKSPDSVTQQDVSEMDTAKSGGLPMQPQFWAHVYGMEGNRVGSAFMTRDQVECLRAGPSSSSLNALPETRSKPSKRVRKPAQRRDKLGQPRVFIGRPLPSWKVRTVRDLESSADVDVDVRGKGKGKSGRARWYIGNPAVLHEPYGRMPGPRPRTSPASSRCSTPDVHSGRSLTPPHETQADDWPQPEVGECCEWAPSVVVGPRRSTDLTDPGSCSTLLGEEQAGLGTGVEALPLTGIINGDLEGGSMLSEQDLARVISVALAAIDAELPR